MTIKVHSTVLATVAAATLAVALSGVAVFSGQPQVAAKGDRLSVTPECQVAAIGLVGCPAPEASAFVTVEHRIADGSVLSRVPVDEAR